MSICLTDWMKSLIFNIMKTKKHVKENVWMKKNFAKQKNIFTKGIFTMIDKLSLTPNTWDIQPSVVTWSKWNMDEIFALKFHLNTIRLYATKFFLLKSLNANHFRIYFIKVRIFAQNYKFSNKNYIVWAWRDFKKNVLYVHIINENLSQTFHPYSILTR